MVDQWLPERLRREAVVTRGESSILKAAREILTALFDAIKAAIRADGTLDTGAMDRALPNWRTALQDALLPAIGDVFGKAFREFLDQAIYSADQYTEKFLAEVENRLVRTTDALFDDIRDTLEEGRRAGEGIPKLAQRVADKMGPAASAARAEAIARTEVIGAYNNGHYAAALTLADALGVPHNQVVKQWLATDDERTRLSHEIADGQQQYLDQPFIVGGFPGQVPGDPELPAAQAINCRCTPLFFFPGDLGYPEGGLTAAADHFDTTVIVALPESDDLIHGVGDEEKHCTMLFLGNSADINLAELLDEVARTADQYSLFEAEVSGRGELGADQAKVVFVESQPLVDLREALLGNQETARSFLAVDQYPNWIPHVTLSYDDMPELTDVTRVMFDRLAVWHGDIHYEFALGGGMTIPAEEPAMREIPDDFYKAPMWYGILAPEDILSGDGRVFLPDSLIQRPLPRPMAWQMENWPGHDGSVVVANIEGMRRHNGVIRGWGSFADDEAAYRIQSQIAQNMGWGISVDVDDFEAEFQSKDGGEATEEDMMDGNIRMAVTSGRISGATIVAIPAFAEAVIQLGTPPPEWLTEGSPLAEREPAVVQEDDFVVTPALVAAGRPVEQIDAFSNPHLTDLTPLTIHDNRIYGHLAGWNVCHTSFGNTCVTAPHSASGYSYFTTGEMLFDNGQRIAVGQITMDTSHADVRLASAPATAHYDQTGTVAADIVMGEDAYGIWFAGMLRRDLSEEDVERLRAAALSGDWRRIGGHMELVAALAVNVPGFPIPRTTTSVQSRDQVALVASGIVLQSPPQIGEAVFEVDTMRIAANVLRDMEVLRLRTARRERAAAMIGRDKAGRVAAARALLADIEED